MKERYKFRLPLKVRFADIDSQGHVYFMNYLGYCDEGLMAYFEELGLAWSELEKRKLGFSYVDTGCEFKGSARFAEELDVHTRISRLGNSSLEAELAVFHSGSGELIATGRMVGVFVDAQTGKSCPIPDDFRTNVQKYQGD
ncbi:MAG: acyl-CoA thioesterase [Gammaproteobacteria bacterium]